MKTTYAELLKQSTPLPYRVVNTGSEKYIGSSSGLIADMCRNECDTPAQVAECDANAKLFCHSSNVLPQALEALKDCYRSLERGRIQLEIESGEKQPDGRQLTKVRAAIVAIENVNVRTRQTTNRKSATASRRRSCPHSCYSWASS